MGNRVVSEMDWVVDDQGSLVGVKKRNNSVQNLVSSIVDPLTGRTGFNVSPLSPSTANNPVSSDWLFSTAGLNVGGDASASLFDARTLPNGNILYVCGRDTVTANSETTGVAEVNPVTREIVWQWRDPAWASGNGPESAYKLANGNYLICDTDGANTPPTADTMYEITPALVKVWTWKGAYVNRIRPVYINGRFCILMFGANYGVGDHRILVLDYDTRSIIWSMTGIGTAATTIESAINGGDFRKINGVNYLICTMWQAATPAVVLINYDTQTVLTRTPTGTLTGYGPMDATWISDTECIIATGYGAGAANGFFQIARPFDAAIMASSPANTGRTMCCNVDPDTKQMTWVLNNEPYIRSTNLGNFTGWTRASSAVTFAGGGAPTVSYSGNDAWAINDPVVFTNSGGALPAAVTSGTTYYVKSRDTSANTFTVCATLPSASAAVINMATAGTGTHTCTNGIILADSTTKFTAEAINALKPLIVRGCIYKNASGNPVNIGTAPSTCFRYASIQLGDDPALFGLVSYDWNVGETYLENGFNNASGHIVLRTRVSGTKIDGLRVYGQGWVRLGPLTINVSGLTAAAAGLIGMRAFVNDASVTYTAGIGTVVVGGGANVVPVFCDGTNWRIG
jgi:hypothetical protein